MSTLSALVFGVALVSSACALSSGIVLGVSPMGRNSMPTVTYYFFLMFLIIFFSFCFLRKDARLAICKIFRLSIKASCSSFIVRPVAVFNLPYKGLLLIASQVWTPRPQGMMIFALFDMELAQLYDYFSSSAKLRSLQSCA